MNATALPPCFSRPNRIPRLSRPWKRRPAISILGCIFTPTGGSWLFSLGCFRGGMHLSQEEELIMLLIGLTGKAFAGKDLVAMHLLRQHGFFKMAFADPLREGLKTMLGLGEWNFTPAGKESTIEWIGKSPRELEQTLGTEWGRDQVNVEIWCRLMHRRIRARKAAGMGLIVISDVRFLDEARFIHSHGGHIWRIVRPGAETTEHSDHPSEQDGLRIVEDAAILNDGTIEELKEQVDEAVDKLFDEMGQNNLRRSASCL